MVTTLNCPKRVRKETNYAFSIWVLVKLWKRGEKLALGASCQYAVLCALRWVVYSAAAIYVCLPWQSGGGEGIISTQIIVCSHRCLLIPRPSPLPAVQLENSNKHSLRASGKPLLFIQRCMECSAGHWKRYFTNWQVGHLKA